MAKPDFPVDISRAAEAVRLAGIAFEDDVAESSGWYIGLFVRQDEDDEDDNFVPEPLPEGQRLSVRTREDFIVTDEGALVEAGRTAYAQAWPEDSPGAAQQQVGTAADAIYQLLHAGGLDALARGTAVPGLQNAGGETLVEPVERALQDDPDW